MNAPTANTSWPDRLALARHILAGPGPSLPDHVIDQLGAASAQVAAGIARAGRVMPALQPLSGWSARPSTTTSADQLAHLLAGLLGCRPCHHLRREGPQPVVAALPLRQLDCHRCSGTFRNPPPGDADRCDLCGRRNVVVFTPVVAGYGPATVIGDLCDGCAAAVLHTEPAS
ncbi:MAG: hypothetical protein ACR2MN_14945 [Acidimicrobiales bacterium]